MKRLIVLFLFLALAATLLWFGRDALGPRLGATEWTIGVLVLALLGARWLFVTRRRQRQKVEEMRDSALW